MLAHFQQALSFLGRAIRPMQLFCALHGLPCADNRSRIECSRCSVVAQDPRGVVRSSLFLCAALPVIFFAGPFLIFRLGFALAAFAFLDITILRYSNSFDNCGLLRAPGNRPRRRSNRDAVCCGAVELRLWHEADDLGGPRRSDRTIAAGYSYSPSMSLPVYSVIIAVAISVTIAHATI